MYESRRPEKGVLPPLHRFRNHRRKNTAANQVRIRVRRTMANPKRERRADVKASRLLKGTLVATMAAVAVLAIYPKTPAVAGEKGIIFGRLNDKMMGDSWGGQGKLVVIVGDSDKNKKDTDMCKNGYAALEVDAGKVRLDVVKLPKGGYDGFVDRSEAYLNQPELQVTPGSVVYWGDVKINYEYGTLIFKSADKADASTAATVACLKAAGNTELADAIAKATVEKQLVFVGMNNR